MRSLLPTIVSFVDLLGAVEWAPSDMHACIHAYICEDQGDHLFLDYGRGSSARGPLIRDAVRFELHIEETVTHGSPQ